MLAALAMKRSFLFEGETTLSYRKGQKHESQVEENGSHRLSLPAVIASQASKQQ
jgi:hypothetical protein